MRRSARPTCAAGRRMSRAPRPRRAAALRADLEAHRRESDGGAVLDQVSSTSPVRAARRRATGPVLRFDGFLTLYHEDVDDPRRGRMDRRLPPLAEGDRPTLQEVRSTSPSRRRATPRRAWSRSWRSSGSAAPRPTPRSYRSCRTATMCGWRRSGSFRRTAAGWSPPSSPASSSATCSTSSLPIWRTSSTTSPAGGSTGRRCCATSGASSTKASTATHERRLGQVIDALDRDLGPHFFPHEDGGAIRASARLQAGPPRPQARPQRRVHRLLELPELQLHPAARGRDRRGGRGRRRTARARPRSRDSSPEVTLRKGLWLVCAARRGQGEGEAQARLSTAGAIDPPISTFRRRCSAGAAAQVGRHPETGEPIAAGINRFGPYIKHGSSVRRSAPTTMC